MTTKFKNKWNDKCLLTVKCS